MSDRRKQNNVVEELADLTDNLLKGEKSVDQSMPDPDGEEAQLKEMVRSVARLAPAQDVDQSMKNRIRANLAAKWQTSGPKVRNDATGRFLWKSRRLYAALSIMTIAVFLVVIALEVPGIIDVSPGTAQSGGIAGFLMIVVLGIIALMIWRNKKKP